MDTSGYSIECSTVFSILLYSHNSPLSVDITIYLLLGNTMVYVELVILNFLMRVLLVLFHIHILSLDPLTMIVSSGDIDT